MTRSLLIYQFAVLVALILIAEIVAIDKLLSFKNTRSAERRRKHELEAANKPTPKPILKNSVTSQSVTNGYYLNYYYGSSFSCGGNPEFTAYVLESCIYVDQNSFAIYSCTNCKCHSLV